MPTRRPRDHVGRSSRLSGGIRQVARFSIGTTGCGGRFERLRTITTPATTNTATRSTPSASDSRVTLIWEKRVVAIRTSDISSRMATMRLARTLSQGRLTQGPSTSLSLHRSRRKTVAQPYAQLLSLLPQQVHLNADETGHKENGRRYWTWCFRAKDFIFFKIHASRGSDVLFDILGQNFQGSLGADFWGAYRKYASQCGVLIQFCLAHLIREVKYLCEFPEPSVQRYGQALLAGLKELFNALHRRAELSSKAFALALATAEAK